MDSIIFLVSLGVVLWSGGLLVRALARVAAFLEISEFLVAFVLVAIATSLPELFVGIAAGLTGEPALSFGNVVGSNMVNLTLMLALPVFLARGLSIGTTFTARDFFLMAVVTLLPIGLLIDGWLSRVDGIILIAAFVWYLVLLLRRKEYFTRPLEEGVHEKQITLRVFWRDLSLILVSFGVLIVGSSYLVGAATALAEGFGVPVALIGVLVLGFGTNLPELAFSTQAVTSGHGGMVVGGILGSVVANAGLILGITVILSPLTSEIVPTFWVEGIFLLIALGILGIAMRVGQRLSVFGGVVLVALYGLFLVFEFEHLIRCFTC